MPIPTVSIIIPTYNRAYCIKDAIDSVLGQTFQDYELIIVDDGSTDGTHEVVEAYDDRVRLIRQVNDGASAARNAGIRAAKGEWVAFLDSDDTWESEKLRVQMDDLRVHPRVVAHMVDANIVISDHEYVSLFELRGMRSDFERCPLRERPLLDVLKTQFFTSTWMLHRRVIQAVGHFNPAIKIFEDIDLLTRIAMEGPFIVNCYRGVNMRRIGNTHALSDLYQKERLQALQNLLHTYANLRKDPRLAKKELQRVRRLIGGIHCELASQYRLQQNTQAVLVALYHSVSEDPGLRSVARALLTAVGARGLIARLAPWRKKPGFRRSEMNHETQ
jgi:glycosyltransferase involved in cell wall biosynthesis